MKEEHAAVREKFVVLISKNTTIKRRPFIS
jgi:hypothetical protein